MTKITKDILLKISKKYSNICMSIMDFCDLINISCNDFFHPSTDCDIIKNGLYGTIGTTKVWIIKGIKQYNIKLSNKEIFDPYIKKEWLPEIPIEYLGDIERYTKLNAFW